MSGIGLDSGYTLPDQTAAGVINASARAAPPGIGLTGAPQAKALVDTGQPDAPPPAPTVQPEMPAQPALSADVTQMPAMPAAAPAAPAAAPAPPLIDFHKDPLGAIALVLESTAAGYNHTESPVDKLKAQQIAEQAAQYKTAALGLDIIDKTSTYVAKLPSDQRAAAIADLDKRFSPALGGQSIAPFLTDLSSRSDAERTAAVGAIKELSPSPAMLNYFAANPDAAIKFLDEYNSQKAKDATSNKMTVVPPGSTVLDATGKTLFTAADKPVTHTVAPGGTVVDANGKVLYQAPAAASENIAAPTQIGYTGPDGEEVQTAASFDKKTGHYIDAATQQPIVNPKNLRVIGNSSGGARSQNVVNRVLTSTEDATSGIENLARASVGQSKGLFPNLVTTPLSALSRAVTPQDIQDYNATNAGLGRAMGALATGGMAVDEMTQKSFEGLNLNQGDSYITKMRKLAELRQQSQNAIDVQLRSSLLNAEQKTALKVMNTRISAAIPWTVTDVQNLENSGNPKLSLRDAAKAQGLGAAAAIPTVATPADAAKLPSGTKFKTPDGRILQVP